MIRDALFMLRETVRNPVTASIGVTSKANARRIARKIDWKTSKTVIEYGGGTGPITRALLTEMDMHPHPDHRLIVFEFHPILARKLRQIHHPQLTVLEADVSAAPALLAEKGITSVDAIISGIPLSMLKDADTIVRNSAKLLGIGGQMIVYQYTSTASVLLKRYFQNVSEKRISAIMRLFEAKN